VCEGRYNFTEEDITDKAGSVACKEVPKIDSSLEYKEQSKKERLHI
jgi:hypothetical protein